MSSGSAILYLGDASVSKNKILNRYVVFKLYCLKSLLFTSALVNKKPCRKAF